MSDLPYCLVVFLMDSGLILKYPHFFKTGSPVFYFLAISILWLGRAQLYGKKGLGKWDYVFVLLPLLNIIEFTPFYLQSYDQKKAYLLELIANRNQIIYAFEGWIPTFFHYFLQVVIGGFVSLFLLFKAIQQNKASETQHPASSWMIGLAAIFLVFYTIGLGLLLSDSEQIPIHQLASWLFGLMLLFQLFFLFFRPDVLYGIASMPTIPKPTSSIPLFLEVAEATSYRANIDAFFETHTDFLKYDFRQQHLSDHLGIPKNRLSQIIQQVFNLTFNQLTNKKRIELAVHKLQNKEWKHYTIEAIAQEIGFKSRTTFNKAFQEQTGLTPSQFRKQIEKE